MKNKYFFYVILFILTVFSGTIFAADDLQIYFFKQGKICKINSDGTNQKVLTSKETVRFQWSPDGKNICFMSKEGLFLVNQNNEEKLLADFPPSAILTNTFEWSPDSKKIVYGIYDQDTNRDNTINVKDQYSLYLVKVATLFKENIASINGTPFQTPFYWSKNGTNLYFTTFKLYSCDVVKVKYYRYAVDVKKKYLLGTENWPENDLIKHVGKTFIHFNQNNELEQWSNLDTSSEGKVVFIEIGSIYLKDSGSDENAAVNIAKFDYYVNRFNTGYTNPVWLPDGKNILVVKNTFFGNSICIANIIDNKTQKIKKICTGKAANYFHK